MLVSGILIAGCSSGSDQKMSIIELVPENDEVLVNEKTDIEIKTDPKDTVLTASDFVAGKGKIEVDGNLAVFCASETGTYTIKASKDGITSNPVSIKVVNAQSDSEMPKPEETTYDHKTSDQNKQNTSGQNK